MVFARPELHGHEQLRRSVPCLQTSRVSKECRSESLPDGYDRNCDASDPNVWCSLGVLFYQLNQYLDALDAYSRAINLNPNICEVWYNVGTLYDTCNQTNDARDAYQKAAELGADAAFIRERLEALQAKESGARNTSPPSGPSEPPTIAPMGPA